MAVLLLVGLLAAGCGGGGVNAGDLNVYDLDAEWALGHRLASDVESEVPLLADPAATALVDRIGQRLAVQTELADREWTFRVVDDPAVNAFAVPGGHIYVNTGLIGAVGSEAELAAVLAHEVAHVEARHSTEQLTRTYGLQALLAIAGAGEGLLEQLAVQVLGAGATAKFSRDAEREADALGVERLASAGYPPEAMAGFFELLLAQEQRRPNAVEQFFASHPITEERLERVRELAATIEPAAPATSPGQPALDDVQRRLAA